MSYSTLSYSANEILTSGKMNQASDNDEALRDGTGLLDDIILERHILDGEVTAAKRSEVVATGIINESTTGNKTYNIGFKPKVILFFTTVNIGSTSTTITHAGYGIATASFQVAHAIRAASSAFSRKALNTRCLLSVVADGTAPSEASLVSMNNNGFTLNFHNASGLYYFPYIAIA